jgi:hypothetical protein
VSGWPRASWWTRTVGFPKERAAGSHGCRSRTSADGRYAGIRDLDVWYSHHVGGDTGRHDHRGHAQAHRESDGQGPAKDSMQAFASSPPWWTAGRGSSTIHRSSAWTPPTSPSDRDPPRSVPSHAPGRPQASRGAILVRIGRKVVGVGARHPRFIALLAAGRDVPCSSGEGGPELRARIALPRASSATMVSVCRRRSALPAGLGRIFLGIRAPGVSTTTGVSSTT